MMCSCMDIITESAVPQIVRLMDISNQQDVTLIPARNGWKFLISHPSRGGKNYYYVSIPAELVINAMRDAGVTTSFARRV